MNASKLYELDICKINNPVKKWAVYLSRILKKKKYKWLFNILKFIHRSKSKLKLL